MRRLRIDAGKKETAKSRLGRSLIRIHQARNKFADEGQRADELFEVWQQKWGDRRVEIARRLQMIESQLASLDDSDTPRPQLTVVSMSD